LNLEGRLWGGSARWRGAVALGVGFAILACCFGKVAGLEPRSEKGTTCRNTVQGVNLITDEKGYVCKTENLDWVTGCCVADKSEGQHLCDTCDEATMCCTSYEMCVSCCLGPQQEELRKQAMEVYREKLTYKASVEGNNVFEFCRASCRTSSKSTVHGNAYMSTSRFCVSPAPLSSKSIKPPADLQVVAGDQGASCDQVCAARKASCDARFIPFINNCGALQDKFPCPGTKCEENYGHDQPAYVSNPANKEKFGTCLVNKKEQYFSCNGNHADTQRLCPCRPNKEAVVV